LIGWLGFILAITGNALVVLKYRSAFWVWNAANAIWIWFAIERRDWAQVAMFMVYFGMNVWGFLKWKTTKEER